jgi:hypothetical protein
MNKLGGWIRRILSAEPTKWIIGFLIGYLLFILINN